MLTINKIPIIKDNFDVNILIVLLADPILN